MSAVCLHLWYEFQLFVYIFATNVSCLFTFCQKLASLAKLQNETFLSHFQTLCSRVKFTFILLFRIETMKLNGLKWSQQKDINFSVLMIILRIWNCLLCFVRRRKPNGMVVDFNSDHANSWHLKRHLGMRRGDRNWAGYIEDLNSNPMPIHGENLRLKEKKKWLY